MADVFLSYKREDQRTAREIADDLEAEGFSVFFDARIDVGDSWDKTIERELEGAKAVVALWSPRSRDSEWVRREAREAGPRLTPATIEACKPPLEFSDIQSANLIGRVRSDRRHPEWRRMCQRIAVLKGEPQAQRGGEQAAFAVKRQTLHPNDPEQQLYSRTAAFDPTSARFAIGYLMRVGLFDRRSGQVVALLERPEVTPTRLCFSKDGAQLLAAYGPDLNFNYTRNCIAAVWDLRSTQQTCVLSGHTARLADARFDAKGVRILTASWDKTVRLWNAKSGKEMAVFNGHTKSVNTARFSPDEVYILSAAHDGVALLWHINSGREVGQFLGHQDGIRSATFAPDGASIVTASHDRTARVWDVASRRETAIFRGHNNRVIDALFSPSGRHVVSAGDNTVRIWSADTAREIHAPLEVDGEVSSIALSDDGRDILVTITMPLSDRSDVDMHPQLWTLSEPLP